MSHTEMIIEKNGQQIFHKQQLCISRKNTNIKAKLKVFLSIKNQLNADIAKRYKNVLF